MRILVISSKMRLSGFLIQDETFRFSYPRWAVLVFLSKMRLSGFLIQDETFRFSHPVWDFPVFKPKMRLSGFLIQDETFRFSYPRWDFPVFSSKIRLSGFLIQDETLTECMKKEKKAHTKTAPVYAVKKPGSGSTLERMMINWPPLSCVAWHNGCFWKILSKKYLRQISI